MTLPTPQQAPATARATGIDLDWGSPGARDKAVSLGGQVALGPIEITINGGKTEKVDTKYLVSAVPDPRNLKEGARGIRTYVDMMPGGHAFLGGFIKPIDEQVLPVGNRYQALITHTNATTATGKIEASLFGTGMGLEIGAQTTIKGTKLFVVERLEGNRLQYTMKQEYDVEKGVSATFSLAGFKGRSPLDSARAGEKIVVCFDMDTPEGRKANRAFLQSGIVPFDPKNPSAGSQGVVGYAEYRNYEMEQSDGTSRSLQRQYNPRTQVAQVTETIDNAVPGNADLVIDRTFVGPRDAQTEMVDKRRYTFTFIVANPQDADALRRLDFKAAGLDADAFDDVKFPARLKLMLDERQMNALMANAALAEERYTQVGRRPGNAGYNVDALLRDDMPPGDRTLVFAQLVAGGVHYRPGTTVAQVRAVSDPAAASTQSALQTLAFTTDAAHVGVGGPGTDTDLFRDGRVAPVAAERVVVTGRRP